MKGKKTDLSESECPIARALDVVGDWWTLLIIRQAFGGVQRFSEFQKTLQLAKNILSTRLRKLVEQEIFSVEPSSQSPARNRYVLTEKGESLYVILVALWQWGEKYRFAKNEIEMTLVDERHGARIAPLRVMAADGRRIDSRGFYPRRKSGNPVWDTAQRPNRAG